MPSDRKKVVFRIDREGHACVILFAQEYWKEAREEIVRWLEDPMSDLNNGLPPLSAADRENVLWIMELSTNGPS